MQVRVVTLVGLGLYGLAGPVLAVAMASDRTGLAAGLLLWAGLGGLLVAILLALRAVRRDLRRVGDRLASTERACATVLDRDHRGAEQLAQLQAALLEAVEQDRQTLQATVDARVLGLHALVRDLAAEHREP